MKHIKKMTALILALALSLSLAACGAKTPEEVIRTAQEKVNSAKSMEATMVMDMEMTVMEQTMAVTTTMDMSYFADPIQMRSTMEMDMGALGVMTMDIYAQADGDQYTVYLTDGSQWTSQQVELAEMQQYDARSSMDLYLNSASSFQADGSEKLSGGDADKYTGVITGASLEEVMQSSGALDSMSQLIGDPDAIAGIYQDLADMPVTIWVDKKSGYPVRYVMDMSDTMSQIMEKTLAAAPDAAALDLKIGKMLITMDCFNFGAAETFTIPQEALDAAG